MSHRNRNRRQITPFRATQLGAMLSLTLVAWDDEQPAPPAVLHLPLVGLTWLLGLWLSLRANTRRARREIRWGWQSFLHRCEQFFIGIEISKILGRSLLYALGGNIRAKTYPSHVPLPLQEFFNQMILHDVRKRPPSALSLVKPLSDLREKIFGRRSSEKKLILS